MAVSLRATMVAGALLQLPPVPPASLDRDDLAVVCSALSATAVVDMGRGGADGELLVLEETAVICSSNHHSQVACIREGVDLRSTERTALSPLFLVEIADRRVVLIRRPLRSGNQ